MLVPLSWLKKYVPVAITPSELAHKLTMAGTEVSGVREIGETWDRDKVLVGHVLRVDRHPDADRLTLPTVDLGNGETMTVVCGAPNVATGQRVAFAREGARLVNARSGRVEPLKAAKIRGVLSAGMVCSERELGLGESHDGILVLDEDAPVGIPLVEYLGDAILDLEVTPNRPDCLSILGVAHEVAALTGQAVTEPDLDYVEAGEPIESRVAVEISDPELCHRYAATVVTVVKVGPSPRWLQDALASVGQRPINNIVDVTNYVMLEYGQPLHAFDLDAIKDARVVIRTARRGERLAMLDDETRSLRPPMLAIADSRDAIALAGVMGGTETAVTDATTSILLESASFDAINTRRTSAALGLRSEASYRFERGIRADLVPRALRRATRLMLDTAGGRAARGVIDVHPGRTEPAPLRITQARIRQVLGVELGMDRVTRTLGSLGFRVTEGEREGSKAGQPLDGAGLWVEAPYWRSDISIEEDLVEEVARVIGYDSIPTTGLSSPIPHHAPRPLETLRERVRDSLVASGMNEVISYSLTDRQTLEAVGALDDGVEPLRLANPMSDEMQYLRTGLRGSVLQTLASNRRVSQGEGFRLFEIARVYLPREEARERDLPDERQVVVGVMSGPRFPTSWLASKGNMGFFDAKGLLEALSAQVGLDLSFDTAGDPTLSEGETATLHAGGQPVGVVGEVRRAVLERFDLDGATVALFEIDLDALAGASDHATSAYGAISRFPESERDLALIVDASVPSARIQEIIERHKLVKRSTPFDYYTGEGVPDGQKSVAYRVVFQSGKGTLTADLVDRAQGDILRQLGRAVGAERRE